MASPPLVPELLLCLADEITPLWQDLEAWLGRANVAPPYWAFCWPGGQALTRYLLDHPEAVRGCRVLDLAAGCGASAIAAAKQASAVQASDIDPLAITAIGLNAALNAASVEALLGDVTEMVGEPAWDVILAGDVCYEKSMTEKLFLWLLQRAAAGATVLIADPGRNYLPKAGLHELACYDVATSLDLEKDKRRDTRVYRVAG